MMLALPLWCAYISVTILFLFLQIPSTSSFISPASNSIVSRVLPTSAALSRTKFEGRSELSSFALWDEKKKGEGDILDKEGPDSAEETVKKYGLEAGIWKSYFDKSSKVKPKDLISRYGIAYFGTSITLAIISYALCYVLIANGVDVGSLLQKVGIKPSEAAVSAGTGGLAYAVHKAASPIRFVPTIVLTPLVARWIGKKPKEEEAPDIIAQTKDETAQ